MQQHVGAPEIQTSESLKSTHARQVASTEMVEKVEIHVAMLTAGIEKRADGDEFVSEFRAGGATGTRQQQCVCDSSSSIVSTMTDIDTDKRAGAHAQAKREHTRHHHSLGCHGQGVVQQCEGLGEIDKHVSDGVNKLLIENKRDLTSQEGSSTDEAKELADVLKRVIRVRRVKVPRRSIQVEGG